MSSSADPASDRVSPVLSTLQDLGLILPSNPTSTATAAADAKQRADAAAAAAVAASTKSPVPSAPAMQPLSPTMHREGSGDSSNNSNNNGNNTIDVGDADDASAGAIPIATSALAEAPLSPSASGAAPDDRATYESFASYLERTLLAPLPAAAADGSAPAPEKLPRAAIEDFVLHHGVPDRPRLRSVLWKLLLGYLPWDRAQWRPALDRARASYAEFQREVTVNPYTGDIDPLTGARVVESKPAAAAAAAAAVESKTSTGSAAGAAEAECDPLTGLPVANSTAGSAAVSSASAVNGPMRPVRVTLTRTVLPSTSSSSSSASANASSNLFVDPLSAFSSSKPSAAAAKDTSGMGPTAGAAAGAGAGGKGKNAWDQYFADEEIRNEIEKDVRRTYSSLHFFQLPVHPEDKEAVVRKITQEALAEAAAKRAAAQRANAAAAAGNTSAGSARSKRHDLFGDDTQPNSNSSGSAAGGGAEDATPSLFGDSVSETAAADTLYARSSRKRQSLSTGVVEVTASVDKGPLCHHDVLRRLLFLYAKLNPGIRYVQGMNEILAPLYYVFASDADPFTLKLGRSSAEEKRRQERSHSGGKGQIGADGGASANDDDEHGVDAYADAEADAFFCFTNIMSEVRDRFIKSLDHSDSGVLAVVDRLNKTFREVDPDLWAHLDKSGVDPRFYSFRWLTLLVSQEFELPEVLRLWDSFFADTRRFEFHVYFCCAMLVRVRETLLAGEFSDILHVLQQYPDNDIQALLLIAHDLRACHQRGVRSKYSGLSRAQALVKSVQESKLTQFFKSSFASFGSDK